MKKPKNIDAAKRLVTLYRAMTIEKIRSVWDRQLADDELEKVWGKSVANELFGFGSAKTCSLCAAVDSCVNCIYFDDDLDEDCSEGDHEKTYYDICYAETPKKLFTAINDRADHIETFLKKWEATE